MQTFEANLPEGSLDPITEQIIIFALVGKPLKLCTETVYDTATIHERFLGLQSRPRNININDMLVYELSLLATAMFDSP